MLHYLTGNCDTNQFTFDSQKCIPKTRQCNNRDDCGDNSDELNCGNIHTILLDMTLFDCTLKYVRYIITLNLVEVIRLILYITLKIHVKITTESLVGVGCAVLQLVPNVEGRDVQKKVEANVASKESPKKERYVARIHNLLRAY